jgi:hypothetical protein
MSVCASLIAEACNTGPEPLIRNDVPAFTTCTVVVGEPELYSKRNHHRSKRLPRRRAESNPARPPVGVAARSPPQTVSASSFPFAR